MKINDKEETRMYMADTGNWRLERIFWLLAGVFALASAAPAAVAGPWWLILTALVGVNLIIFSFTGLCLMANVLYGLGARPRPGRY